MKKINEIDELICSECNDKKLIYRIILTDEEKKYDPLHFPQPDRLFYCNNPKCKSYLKYSEPLFRYYD